MKVLICSLIIGFLLYFGMGLFPDHAYEHPEPERVSWQIQEEKRLQRKYAAVDREWLYVRPLYKEVPDVYIYPQNSARTGYTTASPATLSVFGIPGGRFH